ncbi:MAG: NB-ARC domain-containing protein [Nostocales cyanobacterium 94392]|nr:NB-ARC domain-containing protein [Nostocales cyanobacterium 94392]
MATLKASTPGIAMIKQARIASCWSVDDFRWLESASEVLGVSWQENGVLAVGISEGTWKRFLAGKRPINAEAFKAYCQVLGLNWQEVAENKPEKLVSPLSPSPTPVTDWGDAPDVSFFYGRQAEIQIVKQWVVQEKCRLITLLGMGGIGKTTLSVKVAQQIVEIQDFGFLIWRSLRNTPPIEDILVELIQLFSKQQETILPDNLSGKISLLLKLLRSRRCLVILDNVESILQASDRTGKYQAGYEGYGELLRCVAETSHQSCLILTSREKPQGLAKYEGERLPVRSLQLTGLTETEGRELFALKGQFRASEIEWQALISRYGGNPLALKIVASSIHDFFDGDVCQFLAISPQNTFIFDDIRDLLDHQFYRLTKLEQEIMFWVAINREPISLSELKTDFVNYVSPTELLESLSSLQRRSFLEKTSGGLTQQPVVMEYVINQIIELVSEEIVNQEISLFASHALMKAQAKDYVRETQVNLVLQPIINQLINQLGSSENIYFYLNQIISNLRGKTSKETGYVAANSLNLLHQAQIDISGWDFSGLTLWQAYLQGVNLHDVNFANSDLSRCVFTETLGNILSAAFNPNGEILATCDTDCNVRIWEVKTGKLLLICQGHQNWVRFVTFNPDGKMLASCGADHHIKLWNITDGICIKTLTGHHHEIFSVAFSPKSNILASGSGDRTIKIWNIHDGDCIKTLTGHTDWVRCVAFSPDGEILASSGAEAEIKLWDVKSGKCLQTLTEHQSWVRSIAFSSDNQTLASGSGDRTIKIWNYHTGKCIKTYTGHTNSVYSVAFNPTGEILVSGSGDRTVKIWDCKTHTCIKTLHKQTNEVCCVAVSPDDQTIACVSLDQTMRLWDYHSGQCLKTWQGNTDWALPVKYSPNGQFLASGSNDKTIKLWDLQTGNCLRSLSGHTDFIYGLSFHPQGEILASASTDSTVRLWTVNTGKCFQLLQGHTDWVYAVEFHPNGEMIASASADCTIKIWDSHTGQCLNNLTGHTDKILGIAFSDDGKILASASADQTVRIWDWQTGNCVKTLNAHEDRIYAVIFSPDRKIFATCSTDQTIKLWQFPTGKFLKTLTGHHNWVFSIAFSPDGKILVSASHDQTVRIWDVNTGECQHICRGHTHLVSSIAFSSDSQFIASGSQDQTVRIWDINMGECTTILIAKRLYEGMRITGVKGLTEATIFTLQALGAVV